MLHITNGDAAAANLRLSGVPGEVAVVADVLHEGPCLTGLDPAEWCERRARYLAEAGYAAYDEALERLVEADAALHAAASHDEVVLWFEHDLFDQLLLVRVLAWFAARPHGPERLSLICIGSHPAFTRFTGLGQLSPRQLGELFPARAAVTGEQRALAAEAWRRFGLDDPRPFAGIAEDDTSALPFLTAAIRRLIEEFPSVRNGLSRSEQQLLAAVTAGAGDLVIAFRSTQEMEEAIFMGDTTFYEMARRLARAALPLVRLDPHRAHVPPSRQTVALTPLGREVLAGRADHAAVNGLDRWIGGVHLVGHAPRWRQQDGRLRGGEATDAGSGAQLSER